MDARKLVLSEILNDAFSSKASCWIETSQFFYFPDLSNRVSVVERFFPLQITFFIKSDLKIIILAHYSFLN